jgi:hypothetical protein
VEGDVARPGAEDEGRIRVDLSAHLLPEFGSRKVSTITPELVEAYLNRLAEEGTKPGTRENRQADSSDETPD